MADKNIQITVRNPINTDWDELYPVTKAENIIGVGAANGIAELDATGNVPSSQLGNVPAPVLSADNITLANANLAATNVDAGMTELFTNVSNGKTAIASAITGMGQSATGSDSFATLATKISDISDDANAVVGDVLSGKTFYQGGSKKTGTMANRGAVSQALAINGSYTIPAGYHNGTGKVTQSITTKAAQTFTPSTSNQTIAAGQYLSGTQTIAGDADLISANIKSGANIFGVAGNAYVVNTSAGDAAASQILSGKKAYVDGALITGTIPSKAAQTYTPKTTNQTISAGQYLSGTQTIAGSANLVAGNIRSGVNIFGVVGNVQPAAIKSVQKGISSVAGNITITTTNMSKSFVISRSKGSAGTVAVTGSASGQTNSLRTTTTDGMSPSGHSTTAMTMTFVGTIAAGTTNLTSKEYSAKFVNAYTLYADGPVEWQVIEYL